MASAVPGLIIEKCDKILVLTFNNPKKKNCLSGAIYEEIGRVLREVANDDTITLVVFTGTGEYFTAGNDFTQAGQIDDMDAHIKKFNGIFKEMVRAVLDCPKVTVALVNGPSIGIGATLTAVCDLAWCSETAYFITPFTKLGLVPECCSSYTFPNLIGRSKASEMLLFSEKMSAEEALSFNFVSKVFNLSELQTIIWPKLKKFSEFPKNSLLASKRLCRLHENEILHKILDEESVALQERFRSEEFFHAVVAFANRKKQSKL